MSPKRSWNGRPVSHSFATAFLRNLRCTTVLSTNVQSVRLLKNGLNYDTRWLPPATPRGHAANGQQPPARDVGRKKCTMIGGSLRSSNHI